MRFRFLVQEEGGAGRITDKLSSVTRKTLFQKVNEKVYADSGPGKWFGVGGKGVGKGGWDRYNTASVSVSARWCSVRG